MKQNIKIQLFLDPQYWDSNLRPLVLDPSGNQIFIQIYLETHPLIRKVIQINPDPNPLDWNPLLFGNNEAIRFYLEVYPSFFYSVDSWVAGWVIILLICGLSCKQRLARFSVKLTFWIGRVWQYWKTYPFCCIFIRFFNKIKHNEPKDSFHFG